MKDSPGLKCSIISDCNLVDLAARWRGLEAEADASFFQSWLWIGTWRRHIPKSASPLLLEWSRESEPVALGLVCGRDDHVLRRLSNRAAFLNETGRQETNFVIEYNGLLIRRGHEAAVSESFLDYFLIQKRWDEMILSGINSRDCLLSMPRIGSALLLDVVNIMPSWFVDLEKLRNSGKSVLEAMSRNSRYQLRKALRQLEDRGELLTECAQTTDEAMQYFDGLKRLHQIYWQGKGVAGAFANPRWEAFHRDLVETGMEQGRIQLLRFKVGEEVLGYLYNLVYRGRVSMLQSGFHYEEFADQKPGYVCNYLAIEYNLQKGMSCYDFLAGDDQYKRSLANEAEQLCWVALRKKNLKNRFENLLLKTYRRLKRRPVSMTLPQQPET